MVEYYDTRTGKYLGTPDINGNFRKENGTFFRAKDGNLLDVDQDRVEKASFPQVPLSEVNTNKKYEEDSNNLKDILEAYTPFEVKVESTINPLHSMGQKLPVTTSAVTISREDFQKNYNPKKGKDAIYCVSEALSDQENTSFRKIVNKEEIRKRFQKHLESLESKL